MNWLTNDKFADAREKDISWVEIADHFAKGLTLAAEQGEAARTRYQKEAARHTGYSIGMLRNMTATRDWLRTILNDRYRHLHLSDDTVAKSFTALDLIRRLDAHHAHKAEDYLSRLGTATGVRVSALRTELKEIARQYEAARTLPSPKEAEVFQPHVGPQVVEEKMVVRHVRPSLAQIRSWRTMEVMNDIAKLLPLLSGDVNHFARPEGVSPIGVRATAVAWLDEDMTQGDAFEVVNAGHGLSRSTLSDHVTRAIASSRFFRRHYLAFTSDSEPDMVYRTKESLEMLKVPAVGVVWFGHKGKEAILLKPTGSPAPDCRERLKDICKLGHWQ